MSELAIIEIAPDMAPTIYVENGLDKFIEQIREGVNEVPDLSTAKGRARIASLAAQVSRSKTAVENPGRDYLKRLKEQPKVVEAELRRFVTECNNLRDEVHRPLTEWEEDQERIKAEESARIAAEELAKKIEADHEMALLMNANHDREVAEKKAEADRLRIAHEEELKRQAAEKAKREAEEKIERERTESARREAELKLKAEQAERDRIASEQKAAAEKVAAAEQAEREKQEAIAAEQRKAQEEANRIKREAEEAESARVAEQNRIAAENAARAADVEHRRAINASAVQALIDQGIPEDWAKACVIAIAREKVPSTSIKY